MANLCYRVACLVRCVLCFSSVISLVSVFFVCVFFVVHLDDVARALNLFVLSYCIPLAGTPPLAFCCLCLSNEHLLGYRRYLLSLLLHLCVLALSTFCAHIFYSRYAYLGVFPSIPVDVLTGKGWGCVPIYRRYWPIRCFLPCFVRWAGVAHLDVACVCF